MKSGCRHCVTWVASADEDEHPNPGGGLEAARINAFRCQHMKDNHRPRPPTRPRDVHMEQLYSHVPPRGVTAVPLCPIMPPPHRKWPWHSMFPPMPGPATLAREWLWPCSIKTRCWKTISKLSIHRFAV